MIAQETETQRTYSIPLLENHGKNGNNCPLEQGFVCDERHVVIDANHEIALEATVLVLGKLFRQAHAFKVSLGFHLEEFDTDSNVVWCRAAKSGQRSQTIILAVTVYEVARALRHE